VRNEYFEILENLGATGIYGAIASIRMLAFAKTRVRNCHDLPDQQVTRLLLIAARSN
jgi:hypothetical protein